MRGVLYQQKPHKSSPVGYTARVHHNDHLKSSSTEAAQVDRIPAADRLKLFRGLSSPQIPTVVGPN